MSNFSDKFFYHIYPLGMCGAPRVNDFVSPAGDGLRSLAGHIPHLATLGVNAVYIGPLFESSSHGYDTVDYYHVERRLGNNEALKELVGKFHDNGIAVILDAVFNHTGRDFFAFRDIQEHKADSAYAGWYEGLDFSRDNEHGDGFSYKGWAGHTSLVKLNSDCRAVREHLIGAALFWIDEFNIDGLRLDAANVMSVDFLRELSARCKKKKSDFWLMGEIVSGDYGALMREGGLDSVTNYELYKGLWSSFNDKNFFEIAWTLKREFAEDGLYPRIALYNFADNHDVNRVASSLTNRAHLRALYGILFCAPGIPSVYYGSEYSTRGKRDKDSDYALRPAWNDLWSRQKYAQEIFYAIAAFARVRRNSDALKNGNYRELLVASEQFAFARETQNERVIAAVNSSDDSREIVIPTRALKDTKWRDMLSGEILSAANGELRITVQGADIRILRGMNA